MLVSCLDCRHFEPDQEGFGDGLGKCLEYERYKAKNPGVKALRMALRTLGTTNGVPLFWGGTKGYKTRECGKFVGLQKITRSAS